ncbi:uncharacterized protein MELLADRAFT_69097 [Melampsora larici-populina 98AG31]|uniref:Uncharacterized protein n=1 Tax=Melampsora larici-populina (strain 98AG31 / pathotype 3-4-7) TaxID=747676 RepID=F4S9D8_MELLP|nr:uncharacterized protein MELLADRAFT_69097 [Melampsora larici-populina 98AG31]EGF98703.1 hypothetical protein MELLADRAFT_69097 [Melampsora larici-populina 98AG31]
MTSWLVYARKATSDEQKIIKANIAKISHKNPETQGDLPFVSAVDLEGVEQEIEKLCEEAEKEDGEDEIEEDIPTVPVDVGVPTSQMGDLAKHAFSSTCPPVDGHLCMAGLSLEEKATKAKDAFSSTCPPAINHLRRDGIAEGDNNSGGQPFSQPNASGCDSATKDEDKDPEPAQGPVNVRLCIKRPAPDLSPVKSPSPSPQKLVTKANKGGSKGKKGVSKGEVLQDIKPSLPIVEKGGGRGIEVEAKGKVAKPKAKGRKPKVARV